MHPEKTENQSWFLAHNAPAHRSDLFKDNVTTLQHPPYSPDLGEADFYLFPLLKSALKRRHSCYTLRMRRKSWKGFHKTASRNVSNNFTVAGKSV